MLEILDYIMDNIFMYNKVKQWSISKIDDEIRRIKLKNCNCQQIIADLLFSYNSRKL